MRWENDYEKWIHKDIEGEVCSLFQNIIPAFTWIYWVKQRKKSLSWVGWYSGQKDNIKMYLSEVYCEDVMKIGFL
jgi:hypothetical protein